MARAPGTPYYHYDPKFGDPRAAFVPTAEARPDFARPEMPARFVATVEGETFMNSMWGERPVVWRAEPGTPCVILGYWADNSVRLSWPAIEGAYRVDGRFPAWVVAEDPDAKMAGGGHMLLANNPETHVRPSLGETVAALARALHLPI
ncbi:MAG: hypothetical protein JO057_15340 [Chloroflexi bacterium]|nr:hypothetical protein [Chloroflexota bacterium]